MNLVATLGEVQLPDREHRQPRVADDPYIELTSFDVALEDGIGADALVNELHPLAQLGLVVHDRRLGDARRSLLRERLHNQRESQLLLRPYLLADMDDREIRDR